MIRCFLEADLGFQKGLGVDRKKLPSESTWFELRELFCEPYALNPAPNEAQPRVGFHLVKSYETTPGWINFRQPVNLWVLNRETALKGSAQPNGQNITRAARP